jgi:site-specific DNA-methyltransferase (adenine-specific)
MIDLRKGNCLELMKDISDDGVDFLLTDIPYDVVNRKSNGLRNLDKENADILTFNLNEFLEEAYRVSKNSICIFCGKEQFSTIYEFFASKKGTVRPIVWQKSNPSPMNGQYIYLSGVELAVWFKKSGAKVFNAHCKNTVFKYPNGSSKLHPTAKNLELFKELILDNTNENDIVLDTCIGSGTTGVACKELNRNFIGIELDEKYFEIAKERIHNVSNTKLFL